ncbi:MAG: UbiA family prenyltransferase [Thermoplasmata archaeon]|nr:MAG: UbiA family prenyltransferase [Thermoplasmata archaeon]
MASLRDSLKLYSTLSRFEFLPAVTVAILIGIFLGAPTFSDLFTLRMAVILIEGLLIFYLLFNTGFMVNCWADWKVDEIYKKNLAEAVRKFGRQKLLQLVIIHIALAILLTVHLTLIYTFRPEIFVMVLIGIFIGVGYSVEPFRFKSKGGWHSLMALPVFAIPGLFAYLLVSEIAFSTMYFKLFLFIVVGITCAHYGLVLISQAEDYPEDKAAGLRTPPVAWGLPTVLQVSFILNLSGSILTCIAFFLLFYDSNIFLLALTPILVIALFYPTKAIYGFYQYSRKVKGQASLLAEIRAHMHNYPKWHGIPLGMIMLSSFILLVVRSI